MGFKAEPNMFGSAMFGSAKPNMFGVRSIPMWDSVAVAWNHLEHPRGPWEPETPKIHPKMHILGAFLAKFSPDLEF